MDHGARSFPALLLLAALVAGAALFFFLRKSPEADQPARAAAVIAAASQGGAGKTPPGAEFTPPLRLSEAAGMGTSDIALALAGWPEGKLHADLPKWAALLAARGPDAVNDISSALATAGSNTARGVLADALARIGTDNAIQELCTRAVQITDAGATETIASSFRALSRPAAVPMLATLFSETDSPLLVTEASDAIRRLADEAGVLALADLAQEGGQLHSQRDVILKLLAGVQNPDAIPALETLAADTTDPDRAAAAAKSLAALKAAR
jgi:hypothetical protein